MTAEQSDNSEADLKAEIERLKARLASEAQAATVEHERLTFELGHRVRNTLSAVKAIAGQTFRGAASPEAALDAFGDRIVALARANDAILAESWTTATLDAVARSVLMPQGASNGSLAIHGEPVRINASAALSFAMALHELATNARRFGAWSGDGEGSVELAWRLSGSAEAPFELTWTETGGPAALPPDKRGFGLRLVEQSLRSAFGRNVTVAFEPSGLVCSVRAQLADVGA